MSDHGFPCSNEIGLGAASADMTQGSSTTPCCSSHSLFPKGRKRRVLVGAIVSTVLSAIGFIVFALFEQYNGMLSELRGDLKHFNETASEYVKKDKLEKCREQMKECSRELATAIMAREQMERELRANVKAREDLAKEIQRFRERLAYVEGVAHPSPAWFQLILMTIQSWTRKNLVGSLSVDPSQNAH